MDELDLQIRELYMEAGLVKMGKNIPKDFGDLIEDWNLRLKKQEEDNESLRHRKFIA